MDKFVGACELIWARRTKSGIDVDLKDAVVLRAHVDDPNVTVRLSKRNREMPYEVPHMRGTVDMHNLFAWMREDETRHPPELGVWYLTQDRRWVQCA